MSDTLQILLTAAFLAASLAAVVIASAGRVRRRAEVDPTEKKLAVFTRRYIEGTISVEEYEEHVEAILASDVPRPSLAVADEVLKNVYLRVETERRNDRGSWAPGRPPGRDEWFKPPIHLTQAEFDALRVKDLNQVYIVPKEEPM